MYKTLTYINGLSERRYKELEGDRSAFSLIAEECAKQTIPFLYPKAGTSKGSKITVPKNSAGANGVKTLVSKMLLALFPTNVPFFSLALTAPVKKELDSDGSDQQRKDLYSFVREREQAISAESELASDRSKKNNALEYLVVTGNVAIYMPDDAPMKIYKLNQYVVKRDPMGRVIELITKEEVDPRFVDVELPTEEDVNEDKTPSPVTLYTHLRLFGAGKKKRWGVHQEVSQTQLKGSIGSYPYEACPFIVLRGLATDGEDYGRPYVYPFLGDLQVVEQLTEAKVKMALQAAKVLFIIEPGSTVRESDLQKATTGTFIRGERAAIGTLQLDKLADLSIVSNIEQQALQRLAQNFLMVQSIQRNGDRVTAEEIRTLSKELEDNLGAFYTLLAQEFQLPYIQRKIFVLEKTGKIPKVPSGLLQPTIITGLEALGRGHDAIKLAEATQALALFAGLPPEVKMLLNAAEYVERVLLAKGIDPKGLLKDPEMLAQEAEDQQQQQLAQAAVPEGIKQMGNLVNKQIEGTPPE
jgi:hypothetical protein